MMAFHRRYHFHKGNVMYLKLESSFVIGGNEIVVAKYILHSNTLALDDIQNDLKVVLMRALEGVLETNFSEDRNALVYKWMKEVTDYGYNRDRTLKITYEPLEHRGSFDEHNVERNQLVVTQYNDIALNAVIDMVLALMDEQLNEQREVPKPFTTNMLRTNVVAEVKQLVAQFSTKPGDRHDVMNQMVEAIFTLLNGSFMHLPGFRLVPCEGYLDDIEEYRQQGEHWIYPFNTDIGRQDVMATIPEYYAAAVELSDQGPLHRLNNLRMVTDQEPYTWDPIKMTSQWLDDALSEAKKQYRIKFGEK